MLELFLNPPTPLVGGLKGCENERPVPVPPCSPPVETPFSRKNVRFRSFPLVSVGFRSFPFDSGGIRWNPVESVGIRWNPFDSGGIRTYRFLLLGFQNMLHPSNKP